eukprot:5385105-Pleurochrysis_carterae.AAC.1
MLGIGERQLRLLWHDSGKVVHAQDVICGAPIRQRHLALCAPDARMRKVGHGLQAAEEPRQD